MDDLEALVTGANKGLGYAVAAALGAKGFHVWMAARSKTSGQAAVARLREHGIDADFVHLDVSDSATITAAAAEVSARSGHLDALVNNAGISPEGDGRGGWIPPRAVSSSMLREVFDVNFFGTVEVTQTMIPLLAKGRSPRIINVSSALGAFSANVGDGPNADVLALGYKTSKAALNMATLLFARDLADLGIRVNAANPRLTATELIGRPDDLIGLPGFFSAEDGAAAILTLAAMDDGPTGTFLGADGPVQW